MFAWFIWLHGFKSDLSTLIATMLAFVLFMLPLILRGSLFFLIFLFFNFLFCLLWHCLYFFFIFLISYCIRKGFVCLVNLLFLTYSWFNFRTGLFGLPFGRTHSILISFGLQELTLWLDGLRNLFGFRFILHKRGLYWLRLRLYKLGNRFISILLLGFRLKFRGCWRNRLVLNVKVFHWVNLIWQKMMRRLDCKLVLMSFYQDVVCDSILIWRAADLGQVVALRLPFFLKPDDNIFEIAYFLPQSLIVTL